MSAVANLLALSATAGAPFVRAVVAEVTGTTVTVHQSGELVPNVERLSDYTPTIGDLVLIAVTGKATWVVLGAIPVTAIESE